MAEAIVQHLYHPDAALGDLITIDKTITGNYVIAVPAGQNITLSSSNPAFQQSFPSISITDPFTELYDIMAEYLCSGKYEITSALLLNTVNSISIPTNKSIYCGSSASSSYDISIVNNSTMHTHFCLKLEGLQSTSRTQITPLYFKNVYVSNSQVNTQTNYTSFQGYSSSGYRSPGFCTTVPSGSKPYYYSYGNWSYFTLDNKIAHTHDLASISNLTNYSTVILSPYMEYTDSISSVYFKTAFTTTINMTLNLSIKAVQLYL